MNPRILVIGTGNINKIVEIIPHLRSLNVIPIPAAVYAQKKKLIFDPDETGSTLTENALIKATEAARISDEWAMSDDSGLFVDALDGRPGVISARYAGPGCKFSDNIAKVLDEMSNVPEGKRTAHFECVVALCFAPGRLAKFFRGRIEGRIVDAPRGDRQFGYDPIFVPDGFTMDGDKFESTFAEMSDASKNEISHRGIAMMALVSGLKQAMLK